MKKRVDLMIDFGNSESRVIVICEGKKELLRLSNFFAEVMESDYKVPEDYKNGDSTVFKVGDKVLVNGKLAEREFESVITRPSSLQAKHIQQTTLWTTHLAIGRALMVLAEKFNTTIEDLDVVINLSVVVPPTEYELSNEKVEDLLREVTNVNMFVPTFVDKRIEFNNISVKPEGLSAFFAVMFDVVEGELKLVEQNTTFLQGDVLGVDIGAGTTDFVIIRDGELLRKSMHTERIGGNKVRNVVESLIQQKFNGYTPKKNVMDAVIETGYLEYGNTKVDIVPFVNKAKHNYSMELNGKVVKYLERVGVEPGSLKGLLVIGGGSLPIIEKVEGGGDVVKSPAMSDVLLNYMRTLNDETVHMHIGEKDRRLLNIEGLSILHMYM